MKKASNINVLELLIIKVQTESEGFEPSRRLWRLHTFQACSFGQLGQLST